jgi:divalent metal cation (Fe/Co/Zn/Cd) transporter
VPAARIDDFLVGAWPLTPAAHGDGDADGSATQPLTPVDEQRVRAVLLAYPGVTAIHEVLVTFIGPGRAWVIARLDIDDDLRAVQVKSLVCGIESGMKRESEAVYLVDIVPIGRAHAVT